MVGTNIGYLEAKIAKFSAKLKTIVPQLRASGMNPSIVPTTLMAEHYINPSSGTPQFKFKETTASNGGGGSKTERLLKEGEYFMPLGIAMFFGKYDSSDNSGQLIGELFPYVDENYFRGAGEAQALRRLQYGRLTHNINGHDHQEDYDASLLTTRPEGQFMLAADNPTAVTDVYPTYGAELKDQGYKYFDTGSIITTTDDPKLTLDLAPGAYTNIDGSAAISGPTGATADYRNLVQFRIFGLLYTSPFGAKQVCTV